MNPFGILHRALTFFGSRSNDTERGATLVEYVLLVSLIAVVCVTSIAFFGGNVSGMFDYVRGAVESA